MTWKSLALLLLHPPLELGEGEGDALGDDVGSEGDAVDPDPVPDAEDGAVAVDNGAEDEAVAIGGLGVAGTLLPIVEVKVEVAIAIAVVVLLADVPVEVGLVLVAVAVPEPEAEDNS